MVGRLRGNFPQPFFFAPSPEWQQWRTLFGVKRLREKFVAWRKQK
jgi:hypothetical protein